MKIGKKPEINLRIILGIVFLSTIMILSSSCKKPEKFTGPKEKVTIGVGSPALAMPIIIAQEKGFYSDEGLEVTLKRYPSGQKAMEAMFAEDVDIATVADTPIVLNSFIRNNFIVFATFVYSYDENKVLGRKDRGVSTPSDLKGKRIGIAERTSSDFFAHVYLTEHLIDPSAVKLVDFTPTDLPGALEDGRVDAIVIFEPHAYKAMKALPGRVVRLPRSDLYRLSFNLAAMRSYAKGHPGLLKKILKAVDRGIMFIKQNKKESIAVISRGLNLDENIFVRDDLVYELSLYHTLLTTFEDEARWAITNRFTDKRKVPNYLDYLYLDAMKDVKPDAVTITKEVQTR